MSIRQKFSQPTQGSDQPVPTLQNSLPPVVEPTLPVPPQNPAAPASNLSIIILVLGIVALVSGPVGLILGIVALSLQKQARAEIIQSVGRLSGEQLIRWGITCAWIGILIGSIPLLLMGWVILIKVLSSVEFVIALALGFIIFLGIRAFRYIKRP